VLYGEALPLLEREADGQAFRLIGIGAADLVDAALADPPDLFDPARAQSAKVEGAIDAVRAKLGDDAIRRGRALGTAAKPRQAR